MSNGNLTIQTHTWVAFGAAGAIGSVYQVDGGYTFRVFRDERPRAVYPTLEVAKRALHASLVPGTEWPEFREH